MSILDFIFGRHSTNASEGERESFSADAVRKSVGTWATLEIGEPKNVKAEDMYTMYSFFFFKFLDISSMLYSI